MTLINGTGDAPIHDARVLIEDDRIKAVGEGELFENDVDKDWGFEGLVLLTGLIDAHIQLMLNPE